MWEDFCSCIGRKLDISILPEALETVCVNEPMLQLCKALKGKYLTGIITNNSSERFEAITKKMKLDQIFDALILSANIGARKNEALIFESALKAVNCTANECIFIDNQERNLSIPAEMGFHTFLHDDTMNDIVLLKKWLNEKYLISL